MTSNIFSKTFQIELNNNAFEYKTYMKRNIINSRKGYKNVFIDLSHLYKEISFDKLLAIFHILNDVITFKSTMQLYIFVILNNWK